MYPQSGHLWCACSGSIGAWHTGHGGRRDSPIGEHTGSGP
jgi:hypothetical protein